MSNFFKERSELLPRKLPCEVFIICANAEIAMKLAVEVGAGRLASIYKSADSCLESFKSYPLSSRKHYLPFSIGLDFEGKPITIRRLK